MSKFHRSLLILFLDRYSGVVLNFIGALVLARMLTPADFGIYSVAMSVVMMIDVVRDFGVSN
jgi:O-antigen/teichoic acid export membrane protein